MNYRHAFHAGNFADVLKHAVLMLCVEHLKAKDAAFRVLDTHAGAGRYRLDADEASRTGEFQQGISRLYGNAAAPIPAAIAPLLEPYLRAVARENPDGELAVYPGSPALVQASLRSHDKLLANELHEQEAARLRATLGDDGACKVTTLDGYSALKALLPPPERRGVVLIDPPFEEPNEFVRIVEALGHALDRFATGSYIVWYPVKDEKTVARFHRRIATLRQVEKVRALYAAEIMLRPARNPALFNGAGVVLINPPYQLEAELSQLLPFLAARLGDSGKGSYRLAPLQKT